MFTAAKTFAKKSLATRNEMEFLLENPEFPAIQFVPYGQIWIPVPWAVEFLIRNKPSLVRQDLRAFAQALALPSKLSLYPMSVAAFARRYHLTRSFTCHLLLQPSFPQRRIDVKRLAVLEEEALDYLREAVRQPMRGIPHASDACRTRDLTSTSEGHLPRKTLARPPHRVQGKPLSRCVPHPGHAVSDALSLR
jgi:hypothetical protein